MSMVIITYFVEISDMFVVLYFNFLQTLKSKDKLS